jgi:hypothetical protein
MPTKDRTLALYKALLEAALDQPAPTPALAAATQAVLKAIEHRDRVKRLDQDIANL